MLDKRGQLRKAIAEYTEAMVRLRTAEAEDGGDTDRWFSQHRTVAAASERVQETGALLDLALTGVGLPEDEPDNCCVYILETPGDYRGPELRVALVWGDAILQDNPNPMFCRRIVLNFGNREVLRDQGESWHRAKTIANQTLLARNFEPCIQRIHLSNCFNWYRAHDQENSETKT